MKDMKRFFCLMMLLLMSLALLTACGNNIPGEDWRTTGIVRDGGTITRNGKDTFVLVCVHKSNAVFYHDSEEQVLFDSVDYPITLGDNVWDIFNGVDFADLNGDGNSDVTMTFDDGGNKLQMVWFWDPESGEFVYQAKESQLGKDNDGCALSTRNADSCLLQTVEKSEVYTAGGAEFVRQRIIGHINFL